MNEFSLAIGETTFGGREELADPHGGIDYGTLIYVTLQRCKTAREAIKCMVDLCNKYGYYSTGESFTIGDPNEIWIMDLIGKGPKTSNDDDTRVVYVATRVPDGHISGHANQARTTKIKLNDPDNCIYSDDVYTFAKSKGYTQAASIEDFDFTEAYNPLDAGGARQCDGRVFAFYDSVVDKETSNSYLNYVYGKDLTNRLPFTLDISDPKYKKHSVSLSDLQELIGNHFEGTDFDLLEDVSGTYYHSPVRARPIEWTATVNETENRYLFERATGCPQTGWNFVAVLSSSLPDGSIYEPEVDGRDRAITGGILWWSADDATCSVQIPLFPCMTRVPSVLSREHANIYLFNRNTLFWANNMVANWAYTNWKYMKPVLNAKQKEEREFFYSAVVQAQGTLSILARADPNIASEYAFQICNTWAEKLVNDWNQFYKDLFRKFFDGFDHLPRDDSDIPTPVNLNYDHAMYAAIIEETGDFYKYPDEKIDRERLKKAICK